MKSDLASAKIPSAAEAAWRRGIYGRAEARPLQTQNFQQPLKLVSFNAGIFNDLFRSEV
jgi:hypothetical protein